MLSARFNEARQCGRKLLVPYVCAGHPSAEATVDILLALAEAGADAIELGMPFSDPLADGPVIQAAAQSALKAGMTVPRALALAEAYHRQGGTAPLVLMSYVNPLLAQGPGLAKALATAGIQALVVPDLPPEARDLLPAGCPPQVAFVAPNTDAARLDTVCALPSPFLYGVALFGVTGARSDVSSLTLPFLQRLQGRSRPPLLVGFGVSDPAQAQHLGAVADGVIVGSALVRALDGHPDPAVAARAFLAPFRKVLNTL